MPKYQEKNRDEILFHFLSKNADFWGVLGGKGGHFSLKEVQNWYKSGTFGQKEVQNWYKSGTFGIKRGTKLVHFLKIGENWDVGTLHETYRDGITKMGKNGLFYRFLLTKWNFR